MSIITGGPETGCSLTQYERSYSGCEPAGSDGRGKCNRLDTDGAIWTSNGWKGCGFLSAGIDQRCKRTRAPNANLQACCVDGSTDITKCSPDLCPNGQRCHTYYGTTYCKGDKLQTNLCNTWGKFDKSGAWVNNMKAYCVGDRLADTKICRDFAKTNPLDVRPSMVSYCTAAKFGLVPSKIKVCEQPPTLPFSTINKAVMTPICKTVDIENVCKPYALLHDDNQMASAINSFCKDHLDDPFCACDTNKSTYGLSFDDQLVYANPQCFNPACKSSTAYKTLQQKSGYHCPTICIAKLNAFDGGIIQDVYVDQHCVKETESTKPNIPVDNIITKPQPEPKFSMIKILLILVMFIALILGSYFIYKYISSWDS